MIVGSFHGVDERRRRVAGPDRMTIEEVVRKVLLDEHADVIREAAWRRRCPFHTQLGRALRSNPSAVCCSFGVAASVSVPGSQTPAQDEEEAYARRAVRRLLTSANAVAHARAAGALATRPLRA